jgi:hypothetical protein
MLTVSVHRVSQPSIKVNDGMIGSSDLQIDFRASHLPKQPFRFLDD